MASDGAGQPDPAAWASLIERLVGQLDRGGREWTLARRKDSLRRVLASSRSDAVRLQQRLGALLGTWESDRPAGPGVATAPAVEPAGEPDRDAAGEPAGELAGEPAGEAVVEAAPWRPLVGRLHHALAAALPPAEPRAQALAERLAALAARIDSAGASAALVADAAALCQQAERLFAHRHHLVDQLATLCRELAAGLTDLAEDDSWARGQCDALQARLADTPSGPSARSVRAATELLAATRERQLELRTQRNEARDALKQLLAHMLDEVGTLGDETGRFHAAIGRHAQAIAAADSLTGLAGVVQHLLNESRTVAGAVAETRERLQQGHDRAEALGARVRALEAELRRLSEEVSTDALTQVANRRGLAQAFAVEAARSQRDAAALAVALIDIDNFKRLNDSLGHAAGDAALQRLAATVRERLRPVDHLARFGGEEFVVLLPGSTADEAQGALTRLQRSLSAALFEHDGREVFVTFSAGVTAWRSGEPLETALERADEALYEAKRTGKNRSCMA